LSLHFVAKDIDAKFVAKRAILHGQKWLVASVSVPQMRATSELSFLRIMDPTQGETMNRTGMHCSLALSVLSVICAGLLIDNLVPYALGVAAAFGGGGLIVVLNITRISPRRKERKS
jgi:hypothetical protein